MELQEIKNKFQQAFGKYSFVDEGHYYHIAGKRVGISTTGLIHQYGNEFDSDTMSERVAKKRGITQQELLEEWRIENLHSTIKGTMIHEYAQSLWANEKYIFDYSKVPSEIDIERLKSDVEQLIPQADNFYNDYKDMFSVIGIEIYLGDEEFDECGATDIVFLNNYTGGIVVADFKTNKEIVYKTKYNQRMKVPLQDLDDVNFIHYSLQLCNYSFKIEKNTGLKVDEKIIIYFGLQNNNYEIIEPKDLMKEARQILENRRIRNMKSMAVLVIGPSGSGKSASLRNVDDSKLTLINVLGKQLPFKNTFKNIKITDEYADVLKTIAGTKRKLIVLDDAGYLITNQFMKNHSKGGGGNAIFGLYNELGDNYWNLISQIKNVDGGKIVYFFMHEDVNEFGKIKPKSIGKMLDEKVCIEGMFTVVLRTEYKDGKYIMRTKTNGNDVVKTPIGMFENEEVENDLNEIDKVIREYYDLDKIEEEKKEEEK